MQLAMFDTPPAEPRRKSSSRRVGGPSGAAKDKRGLQVRVERRPDSPSAPFRASATRAGHSGFSPGGPDGARGTAHYAAAAYETHRIEADSANGNSVSLEDQMARAAEAKVSHEMAIGVLQKSMDLIRMTIGRGR